MTRATGCSGVLRLAVLLVLTAGTSAFAVRLDFERFAHGTVVSNQLADQNVANIYAVNTGGGPDKALIFDTRETGTADTDLEGPPNTNWAGGNIPVDTVLSNLLIVAEDDVDTSPADGIIDDPDDEAGGGEIGFELSAPAYEMSFNFVDFENTTNQFVHFTDGVVTRTIEFTTFTDTNSSFYTPGLVVGDHTANMFEPLHVSQLPGLSYFTKFWFELPESGAVNSIYLLFTNELGSIGDFVWLDLDGDGIQDGGAEVGIPNVTVALYRDRNTNGILDAADGSIQETAVTDVNGLYLFRNRSPKAYLVKVTDTNNALQGLTLTGGPDPHALTLGVGEHYRIADFGYQPDPLTLAALGDRVWLDENSDGVQDAGEAGIANVTVQLYSGGSLVTSTVTDVNGEYMFTSLQAGTYRVVVDTSTMPPGLAANQTYDLDGTLDDETTVPLAAGQERVDADFGYNWADTPDVDGGTGLGAIGDYVWIDANGDGVQDAGEAGIANVTLRLYNDPDGDGVYDNLVATTNTGTAGLYIFDELPPGAYVVEVDDTTLPAGYTQTGDPDATLDDRTTFPVVLGPGDVYVNADFGYQPGASYRIGDTIYFDTNGDGIENGADYGIAGVSVALVADVNGNGVWDTGEPVIATDITDADGLYLFPGLPNDDYIVWVNDTRNVLDGLVQTGDPDGGLDNRSALTISDSDNLDQDFGYAPQGHSPVVGLIGDTIFLDRDASGTPDAGEGIEGVTVRLYNGTGNLLSTTVTDENGHYYFGDLGAGQYTVRVDTATLPAGVSNTVDPDGGTPNESSLPLALGEINLLQDFGYRAAGLANAIGDTLWKDLNADGTLDPAEMGRFAAVTMALYDTNGNIVATTTTDANGEYLFTGLPDGTYVVDVTDDGNLLNGYWKSDGQNDGANDNSQDDPYTVSVSGGQTNLTADFGYYIEGAALGNYVWLDIDGDGLQNAAEPPLANVLLTLTIAYPSGSNVQAVTTTDANGFYSFATLLLDEDYNGDGSGPEPTYTISAQTPTGHEPTVIDVNSNGNDKQDADDPAGVGAQPVQGVTDVGAKVDPTTEAVQASYDFGFKETPTAAHLARFAALLRDGQVVIQWETTIQIDTLGFFLERLGDAGTYTAVNTSIIPSDPFTVFGALYEQADPGASPGTTLTYRLIEVELDGTQRFLGPYTVSTGGPSLSLDDWSRLEFTPEELADQAVSGTDADPDGDGLTNYQEYLAGTSPTDSADALRILDMDDAANGMTIRWRSAADRVYAIEVATGVAGPYVPVAQGIVGTPPENDYTDSANRGANAFYRIRLVVPE